MYYNEVESTVFGTDGYHGATIEVDTNYLKLRYLDVRDGVKLIADLYQVKKPEDDFCEVVSTSDFLVISTYDNATKEVTNTELLESFARCGRYYFSGTERETQLKQIIHETFNIDGDNLRVLDASSVCDYVRRIIFLKHKQLFKIFPSQLHSDAAAFIAYLNNLEDLEKLSSVMKPDAILRQMKDKSLKFNDSGRKLKQLVGVPVDVIQQLNDYGVGHRLPVFQTYINERGSVDDVRKLFAWLAALKKLNRKRKMSFNICVDSNVVERICNILQYGATIPNLMSTVSREMLMYQTIKDIDLSDILRTISDTLAMLASINYENRTINQNVDKWHYITARNCKLITSSRAEEYSHAVSIINAKSTVIDGYLIKCPETERELFDIGNAYNNCLPIYRDKIIDEGAIIYSMYSIDETGRQETIPTITFEVTKDYDFVQIKTFNDADVTDEQIMLILKEWRKFARKENKNGQKIHANTQSC